MRFGFTPTGVKIPEPPLVAGRLATQAGCLAPCTTVRASCSREHTPGHDSVSDIVPQPECEMIASAKVVGRVFRREHDRDDRVVVPDPVRVVDAVRHKLPQQVTAARQVLLAPPTNPLPL